jgi:hypothetical protein
MADIRISVANLDVFGNISSFFHCLCMYVLAYPMHSDSSVTKPEHECYCPESPEHTMAVANVDKYGYLQERNFLVSKLC